MEGHLWLLLQTLPLLASAAVLFLALGWFWRGRLVPATAGKSPIAPAKEPTQQKATASPQPTAAELTDLQKELKATKADLQEAEGRQALLQKEVLRLADALGEAQSASGADTSEIQETRTQLEAERVAFEAEKKAWLEKTTIAENVKPPAPAAGEKKKRGKGKK